MGTTGIHKTVGETKNILIEDYNFVNDKLVSTVLKTSSYGNQFWLLRRITENGNQFITADVILISHKDGMTYYKEMNVGCGPYYYHCPLEWLEMITMERSDSVRNWEDSVRKYWAKKIIEIVPGMKIVFKENEYIVLRKYSTQFWVVKRTKDGCEFKMKTGFIRDCIVWNQAVVE
jgi:hypothetical protein